MFSKKKDDNGLIKKVPNFKHIEGIPGIPKNALVQISLYPDRITLNDNLIITLDRIKAFDMFREDEVQTKGKSVLGRAAVGGLLLGPLGAIVGGISGTGKKNKKVISHFLSIEFSGVDSVDHVGVFLITNLIFGAPELSKKVNEILNQERPDGPYEI